MAPPASPRPLSLDSIPPQSSPNPPCDDGDNDDLEAIGVADGFRPPEVAANHSRIPSTASQHRDPSPERPTHPRPTSTTKSKRGSLTLRHDGAMGPVASRNSTSAPPASTVPTRSSSISTDAAFVRAESPYQGPTAPSHPYPMDSQEPQLARTASVATASTVPVLNRSSYAGPSGPTHPYGMYPQNTVPEAGSSSAQPPPVLVGFPGLNNEYRRRLGPDGEEVADIIGPDGHTEQLPPYTRYPDEGLASKTQSAASVPLPGAGGIGLATRDPEFSSREDLSAAPSRESTGSAASGSNHQINTPAQGDSEKRELKKWQVIARRRVCGIVPIWALALVGATFVLFAVILAAVLPTLWHKHVIGKHHIADDGTGHKQANGTTASAITITTTIDVSPYTTLPTGLPPLPTGTFQLPITTPFASPSTCLDPAHAAAWSCVISPILPYEILISNIEGSDPLSNNQVDLGLGNGTIPYLVYGAQPPILENPQVLHLGMDKFSSGKGPSWFFQAVYDKLVIVPENALPPLNSKRAAPLESRQWNTGHQGVAQPGDELWFCYFNRTFIEAFIYVNETSEAGERLSSTRYPTSSSTRPPSTATSFGALPTVNPPPYYPKVVKVEERRMSIGGETVQPYCLKYFLAGDGTPQPSTNSSGQPITMQLAETDPILPTPISAQHFPPHDPHDDDDDPDPNIHRRQIGTACGCLWVGR